jgi:hypothetical protein
MNGPNAHPREQADDGITCAPTTTAELGLPYAFMPVLATYAHPRILPDQA